jgi:hypothetical protein
VGEYLECRKKFLNQVTQAKLDYMTEVIKHLLTTNEFDPKKGLDDKKQKIFDHIHDVVVGYKAITGRSQSFKTMERFTVKTPADVAAVHGWHCKLWFLIGLLIFKELKGPYFAKMIKTSMGKI